jgi:hypothetical protein
VSPKYFFDVIKFSWLILLATSFHSPSRLELYSHLSDGQINPLPHRSERNITPGGAKTERAYQRCAGKKLEKLGVTYNFSPL